MVLHLGEDTVVPLKNIIAIIDIKTFNEFPENDYFLKTLDEGFIKYISDKPVKSLIIAEVDDENFIYMSPISSRTLIKRRSLLGDIYANGYEIRGKI